MNVLPNVPEADLIEQQTFVRDDDRDLGLDPGAVRVAADHGIESADLADRIEQAWSTPYADDDDDFSCLAC
ncbi:hypothetical protein ACWEVD_13625 [Nocardia thailandica]|uniref:Uncharacterized protein n=1 Tax=Nocardia thailandica TaxID=257275 RepID=A0ABW6PUN2_9NOCA|nr:hypothetical protein [Nocardia thailandica]